MRWAGRQVGVRGGRAGYGGPGGAASASQSLGTLLSSGPGPPKLVLAPAPVSRRNLGWKPHALSGSAGSGGDTRGGFVPFTEPCSFWNKVRKLSISSDSPTFPLPFFFFLFRFFFFFCFF